MKELKSYFILLICFACAELAGQDRLLDSLKHELSLAKNDSAKCAILLRLAETVPDDNLWPIYNEQVYQLSKRKIISGNDRSLFYHKQLIAASNNKGYLFNLTGQIDSSIVYFSECLDLSKKINEKSSYAESLYNIGKAYNLKGNISKALELHASSLAIAEKENLSELTARLLVSIGLTHHKQKDLIKALEYYEKAYKIQLKIKDKRGSGYSLTNIAGVYLDRKDYTNALKYFTESKKLLEEINDRIGYLMAIRNISKIYLINKDYDNAIENCTKIINDKQAKIYKPILSAAHDMLCAIYLNMNDLDKALKHSLCAMEIAKEIQNPELIRNSALSLAQTYRKTKNFKSSLENYELYIQMRDSIYSQETRKASIKSQLKYEYDKKAAADSVKVAEEKKLTAIQFKQEKDQRYFLYAGLLLTFVFGGIMFNRFRITRKQKNIIEEQKAIVEAQKNLVEEKQKEVLDSIRYAKRIQQSLLPTDKYISKALPKHNGEFKKD